MSSEWLEIKPLGGGGQGTVSLVRRLGQKNALDNIVESIHLLEHTVKQSARNRFEEGLKVFFLRDEDLGAKKNLTNHDEESMARLAREVEVYDAISDPHLLKIVDNSDNCARAIF